MQNVLHVWLGLVSGSHLNQRFANCTDLQIVQNGQLCNLREQNNPAAECMFGHAKQQFLLKKLCNIFQIYNTCSQQCITRWTLPQCSILNLCLHVINYTNFLACFSGHKKQPQGIVIQQYCGWYKGLQCMLSNDIIQTDGQTK